MTMVEAKLFEAALKSHDAELAAMATRIARWIEIMNGAQPSQQERRILAMFGDNRC